MQPSIEIPVYWNQRLELTGLGKFGKPLGLTDVGLGLDRQYGAGRVVGRVWNQTEPVLWSEPGPLTGYPYLFLTLIATDAIDIFTSSNCNGGKRLHGWHAGMEGNEPETFPLLRKD
jgi:hypothetical protein